MPREAETRPDHIESAYRDHDIVASIRVSAAQRAGRLEVTVRASHHPTATYEVQIWRPYDTSPVLTEVFEGRLGSQTLELSLEDRQRPLPAGTYLLIVTPFDRHGIPHGGHSETIELVDP